MRQMPALPETRWVPSIYTCEGVGRPGAVNFPSDDYDLIFNRDNIRVSAERSCRAEMIRRDE